MHHPIANLLVLRLLLAFAASLCALVYAEEPGSEKLVSTKISAKSEFISRLKKVADSGQLYDASAISQLLGIKFTSTSVDQVPQPPACQERMELRSRLVETMTMPEVSWYEPTQFGVQALQVPAFAINPATTLTGPPKISYETVKVIYCGDPHVTLKETSQATIRFSFLPSFLCILPSDIHAVLPDAKYSQATDGFSSVRYSGRLDERSGSSLSFSYRVGAGCALDAEIHQADKDGLRFQRADSKSRTCRNQMEQTELKSFCSARQATECPQLSWTAWEDHMAETCSSVQQLYDSDGHQ